MTNLIAKKSQFSDGSAINCKKLLKLFYCFGKYQGQLNLMQIDADNANFLHQKDRINANHNLIPKRTKEIF